MPYGSSAGWELGAGGSVLAAVAEGVRGARDADLFVEADGGGGGEEDDVDLGANLGAGALDEAAADAPVLGGLGDCEVGQVAAEGAVGEGACDADQGSREAGGDDQVGAAQHAVEAGGCRSWDDAGRAGGLEELLELGGGEVEFDGVSDFDGVAHLLRWA